MSLRINLNVAALTAHRTLSETDTGLGKTIERLSSGYRINSAGDDPAGLVISEKLRAQVSGLGKAISNAGDAVNMVKTAEGALSEVSRILRSMRDLAVHAANTGANDEAAVQADQAQINNSIQSLNKIAQETMFGGRKLLDGTAGVRAYIDGTAVMTGDFSYATGLASGSSVHVKITTAAEQASISSAGTYGALTSTFATNGAGSMFINGVRVDYASGDTVNDMLIKVNSKTEITGVTATYDAATDKINLRTADYGSNAKINITQSSQFLQGTSAANDTGVDAIAEVNKVVGGVEESISDALWTSGRGLELKDSLGNTIKMREDMGSVAADYGTQFNLGVNTLRFQVGAYGGQTRDVNIGSVFANELGAGAVEDENLSTVDVTTAQGAQNAISILDDAIKQISTQRAALGATQNNVLESSITSLNIAKENISASESTIRDTDMASEVVNLTRSQILQQSGVSMLAQANQMPQTLLKLLQ